MNIIDWFKKNVLRITYVPCRLHKTHTPKKENEMSDTYQCKICGKTIGIMGAGSHKNMHIRKSGTLQQQLYKEADGR